MLQESTYRLNARNLHIYKRMVNTNYVLFLIFFKMVSPCIPWFQESIWLSPWRYHWQEEMMMTILLNNSIYYYTILYYLLIIYIIILYYIIIIKINSIYYYYGGLFAVCALWVLVNGENSGEKIFWSCATGFMLGVFWWAFLIAP